jgi:C1A family cysteine protease
MNKLFVFAVLALFAIASATRGEAVKTLWSSWKSTHKKTYSATEEAKRFKIFQHNIVKIAKLNAKNKDVKFGINKFADLTAAEFKTQYANGGMVTKNVAAEKTVKYDTNNLADSVDWRSKGAVTPVKDQGQCGSCWAFSTTGVLEGFYFVNNGKLLSFSEQQIVDCASSAGYGCQGGWPYKAVDYAAQQGLEEESDYPYTAQDGKCVYNSKKAVKINSGFDYVTPKSSDQLKAALGKQPVSVCIEADQDVFQFYKSGVISTGCGANIDHAVLAVGYQKVGALEAFIVKNSWGTSWGNSGYVYISTIQQLNNGQGACGILYQPVVAK